MRVIFKEGKIIKKTRKIALVIITVVALIVATGYMVFQSRYVQTYIISLISNNISQKTNTTITIKRVSLALFRKVVLDEVYVSDQKMDTLLYIDQFVANIDSISFKHKLLGLKSVFLKEPKIFVKRIDSSQMNIDFLKELFSSNKEDSTGGWKMNSSTVLLENGNFNYTDSSLNGTIAEFLQLDGINAAINNIKILTNKQVSFDLKNLTLHSKTDYKVEKLSTSFEYKDSIVYLKNIKTKTEYSTLEIDSLEIDLLKYFESKVLADVKFDMNIRNLDFGFNDISFLYDSFYGKGFKANISGRIYGTLNDLHGRSFNLSVGNFTNINGDFYLNGLPDIHSTYIFCDLKESYANLKEIRNLDLPQKLTKAIDNLPTFLNNVGEFSYKGNFTGFLDNFVAFGTAYSNLGTVRTDVSFHPHKNQELSIQGHVSAYNLDVGTIFNNEKLDKLTLAGELNGTLSKQLEYNLVFNGMVNSIDFNDYKFRKIALNGTIKNKQFIGSFSIADPNLIMDFTGNLDLSPELPVFEFLANIDQVNLPELHMINDSLGLASLKIDANFEGDNIDNVKGQLVLSDINYSNAIDQFYLNSIVLNNNPKGDTSIFTLRSDILDGEIIGHYNFMDIGHSFVELYRHYLPSSYYVGDSIKTDINDFSYNFHIKDIKPVTKVFAPDFYLEPDIKVVGFYRPQFDSMLLETNIPIIKFGNKGIEKLKLKIEANKQHLFLNAYSQRIRYNDRISVYNVTVNSIGKDDRLDFDLFWNNYGEKTYSGTFKTETRFSKTASIYPHIEVNIEPSKVYFADSLWQLDASVISIDSTSLLFDHLIFHHNEQRFELNGKIADDEKATVSAKMNDVNLSLIDPLLRRVHILGKINGEASLVDCYNKFKLNNDLVVSDLAFGDRLLGEVTIKSDWDNTVEKLRSAIKWVNNETTIFESEGLIDPINSQMDMNLIFDQSPVAILSLFMPSSFNNQSGLLRGGIHVHGKFNHLNMDGVLSPISQAGIGLSFLNTTCYFNDPVYFKGDSIVFSQLPIKDKFGNNGSLTGEITHHSFMNMHVNLAVHSDKLMVLNTTFADNEYFYGTAYASGDIAITGDVENILISGNARSEKGTNIYIPFESGENAQQYDFIEFINSKQKEEKKVEYDVVTSGLDMNFDFDITPDAKVQIIFNSQIGDIIKGEGSGNLRVLVDKNYKIYLYGNYVIDEGDYLFTLQNVINKRFSIKQGSTIEWVGDPYSAIIDITALYKVKTSLYDLFVVPYDNIDLTRRIPVDCIIKLSEKLTQPKINFSIELPTAEERIKDQVQQVIATPEEVNKQIISLLMLGRFYTPEFFAGKPTTETGAELFGTTASELFSNQITNWLSQLIDVLDIGINYRVGNEISDDQLEVALSTQILNDRVTLNGNIANNANPNSNNNSDFIGDFDLNIKLTDNGKLQFKAYTHSNDNLIYDTAPNTQGVGFSYREEFNSFKDLLYRYWSAIFKKKEKEIIRE